MSLTFTVDFNFHFWHKFGVYFVFQVLNQHIAQHANYPPSHYSSRETGYNSGTESYRFNRNQPQESMVLSREEVETEIF